jgi:hypothetical protein
MYGAREPDFEDPVVWKQQWAIWLRQFLENLEDTSDYQVRLARKVWMELERAGLGIISMELLWEYAIADKPIAEVSKGLKRVTHNLKALRRADQVAEERSDDPRREIFAQRSKDAAETAAQTEWPFHNQSVKTLSDAASNYALVGKLSVADAASSRGGDTLRRYGAKIPLAILRAGAHAHGVHLSPNALVALGHCASPDRVLDERVLRRFLKNPVIQEAETGYVGLFESLLPRFSSR